MGVLKPWDLFEAGQSDEELIENVREQAIHAVSYMALDRGISLQVLNEMRIGYDPREIKITIPHFWKGDLLGWQKRAMTSSKYPMTPDVVDEDGSTRPAPKYQNSLNLPKAETLYNYDNVVETEPLFVTESPLSVLKGKTYGKEFSNVVATFGAKVTDNQLKWLKKFPVIYLAFDPDFAGHIGTVRMARYLVNYSNVKVMEFPSDYDFGSVSRANLQTSLEVAQPLLTALPRIDRLISKKREEIAIRKAQRGKQ